MELGVVRCRSRPCTGSATDGAAMATKSLTESAETDRARRGENSDGAMRLLPSRVGRGDEDDEGSALVPFPALAQADGDRAGGAKGSKFRPWSAPLGCSEIFRDREETGEREKKERRAARGEKQRERLGFGEGKGGCFMEGKGEREWLEGAVVISTGEAHAWCVPPVRTEEGGGRFGGAWAAGVALGS